MTWREAIDRSGGGQRGTASHDVQICTGRTTY